jgi:hypothetical protein
MNQKLLFYLWFQEYTNSFDNQRFSDRFIFTAMKSRILQDIYFLGAVD